MLLSLSSSLVKSFHSPSEITTDIFINTVCGYLFLKKKQIGYSSRYFKISIDYEGDYKIKYNDVKYLYDLINRI